MRDISGKNMELWGLVHFPFRENDTCGGVEKGIISGVPPSNCVFGGVVFV